MGPMFYLVQCEEARCLISAVLLADWPHELQPWLAVFQRRWRWGHAPRPRPFALGVSGGLGAAFLGPVLKSVNSPPGCLLGGSGSRPKRK